MEENAKHEQGFIMPVVFSWARTLLKGEDGYNRYT
jgi:hypothetical protein